MRSRKRARTATIQLLSGLIFSFLFLSSTSSFAQDLGDVARQERERRTNQGRRSRVYTNEDLARPRILDADEKQAPESTPNSAQAAPSTLPAEQAAPRSPVIEWPKDIPLGDVARFYSQQREEEAGTAEFAAPGPTTVDVDIEPWLFPNPLASP
ncbi:MAG: hypothetical protein ACRD88_12470 [Terriglobia bacterium]